MALPIIYRKWFLILATATLTMYLIMVNLNNKTKYYTEELQTESNQRKSFNINKMNRKKPDSKWRNLSANETSKLSVLGRILFLEETPPQTIEKVFEILVWKYGRTIENRHLKNFGNEKINPFEECSVQNCKLTYEDSALKTADIVIFHLHQMKQNELPKRISSDQIWAFLTDESPYHTFLNKNSLTNYNGVFNWSMTYRMDSDIPVPYGRTVIRKNSLENFELNKRRDVLLAILGSNCGGVNKRWDYVKELKKHITVHVYGNCGDLKTCPGHFRKDCGDIERYQFYLAFENSNCDEYITEKLWWNAYHKNSIPIIMGPSKENCAKLLPPGSYLNVDDYATPKALADYILYLNKTEKYLDFYNWKADFQVLNEHGYFQSKSFHYCRVCEALNYNEKKEKIYKDLSQFWSVKEDCHPSWNA